MLHQGHVSRFIDLCNVEVNELLRIVQYNKLFEVLYITSNNYMQPCMFQR